MIRVIRETRETRKRDEKRNRLALLIGNKKIRITRAEGSQLLNQLKRFRFKDEMPSL